MIIFQSRTKLHGCGFSVPVFFSASAFSFPPLPQAAAGALAVIAYAAAQHANYAPHARFHIPGVGANDQRLRSDAAAPDLGRIVLRRALLFDVLLEDEEAARLGRGRRSGCRRWGGRPLLYHISVAVRCSDKRIIQAYDDSPCNSFHSPRQTSEAV